MTPPRPVTATATGTATRTSTTASPGGPATLRRGASGVKRPVDSRFPQAPRPYARVRREGDAVRWFRRKRKPLPLQPGEFIDGTTPEGVARAYEIFGHLPKMRDAPKPLPNPYGISLAQYVLDEREEWYRGEST
jgi:hypothetical protein